MQLSLEKKYGAVSYLLSCKNSVSGRTPGCCSVLDYSCEIILDKKIEWDFMKVFAPLLWNTLPINGVSCVCFFSLIDLEFCHCLFCTSKIIIIKKNILLFSSNSKETRILIMSSTATRNGSDAKNCETFKRSPN